MRLTVLAALICALAPAAAWRQACAEEPLRGGPDAIRVDVGGRDGQVQSVAIPAGTSASVDLPTDARDVLVSNPKVASAVLHTSRRISLLGETPGQTEAVFFDAEGRRILLLHIRVDIDFTAVGQTINRLLPGSSVHVEGVNNKSLILSGRVANLTDADKAVQIAQQYVDATQVINMLTIAGKDQVMLKVRIMEVQRTVIKQLGFNLSATLNQLGSPQFLLSQAASYGVNGALLGGINAGYQLDTTQQPEVMAYDPLTKAYDLPEICRTCKISTTQTTSGNQGVNKASASINAFEQVGLARTLAEPTLTTVSGEAASFLAGGEYPVPVSEDALGRVAVEFKNYGVGLGFTPVVLSNGLISLKISTEVSEISGASVSTGSGTNSISIPGLDVRKVQDVVELPSGGSMMIAGLLKDQSREELSSLPGLMNLPVLGALFNSRDYQSGQTELVIMVTPYIVQPVSPDKLQSPADGLRIASDPETILLGRLNKVYRAPPSADAAAQNYQGPAGYVIE